MLEFVIGNSDNKIIYFSINIFVVLTIIVGYVLVKAFNQTKKENNE